MEKNEILKGKIIEILKERTYAINHDLIADSILACIEQPSQPEQRQTAFELRTRISDAFDQNSSDANNGQLSVISEDSYSDLIDEIIELAEEYAGQCERENCKKCALFAHKGQGIPEITDEEIENAMNGDNNKIYGAKWYREQIKNK